MKEFIYEFKELDSVLEDIIPILKKESSPLILLTGDLGAGKTTFTRNLVQKIIPNSNPNSPTYNLVNEYKSENFSIFHFDLYRIKSSSEILDLGFEDIWKNEFCLIEWWQIAKEYLNRNSILIEIEIIDENKRSLIVK